MQVFKTALRVFFRHPIYLVIYIVWLGSMGVFMGTSFTSGSQTSFTSAKPNVAVIDRDGSDFSSGLADFLGQHADLVSVADSEQALQDATAQDQAAYIVIIPEGFGASFMDAAEEGSDAPVLDTVVSYESYAGPMMDNLVNEYLGTARIYAATKTAGDQKGVARLASDDLEESSDVSVWQQGDTSAMPEQYTTYMNFSVYTAMLAIMICVAVVMAAFSRDEVQRRDFASASSSLSMNLQIGLACLVITLLVWAWVGGIGLVVFGNLLSGVSSEAIALGLASLLVFCLVALAMGFFIGQLTRNELVMNAAGNIVGLALSFMGGTWIPLDLAGEPLTTIARFTPTYYYGDAIVQAYGSSGSILGSAWLADIGIMALFAAAIFAVALAVGRAHRQTTKSLAPAAASEA